MKRLAVLVLLPLTACVSNECQPSNLERGVESYENGDFEQAAAFYDVAVAEEPDNAHAHDLRGEALLELGRYEEALASLDRAVALDPSNAYAHSHRGQVLLELGLADEAVVEFEHAVRLEPNREHFQRALERARNR